MEKELNIPMWNLRKHGDLLETYAADFVEQHIPAYERTWSIYIGHNGYGHASDLIDTNNNVIPKTSQEWKDREIFSQYHYTVLDALYNLWQMDNLNTEGGAYPHYNRSFLSVNNNLILFHAQLGRVRDALAKAAISIGVQISKEADAALDELWNPRNIVLHGPRIPITWRQPFDFTQDIFIVEPSYESGGWNDKNNMVWSDINPTSRFISLQEYIQYKKNQAIEVASQFFEKINSAVHQHVKEKNIRIAPPIAENYQRGFGISGGDWEAWKRSGIGPDIPLSGSTTAIF
jgi:hypothetical protein